MFHFHASFYKPTNQTNEVEREEIPLFQAEQPLKPQLEWPFFAYLFLFASNRKKNSGITEFFC